MKYPVPVESVVNKIVLLRGEKILLDRDLALLYGVETRALNQAVRRNIKRFPEDFMFTLKREEIRHITKCDILDDQVFKRSPRIH